MSEILRIQCIFVVYYLATFIYIKNVCVVGLEQNQFKMERLKEMQNLLDHFTNTESSLSHAVRPSIKQQINTCNYSYDFFHTTIHHHDKIYRCK